MINVKKKMTFLYRYLLGSIIKQEKKGKSMIDDDMINYLFFILNLF